MAAPRETNGEAEKPRDRRFDPWRRAASPAAQAIVDDVRAQLENFEKHAGLRRRKRRPTDQRIFEQSVAAIVCDMMHRELTAPGGAVAISLSNQVLGRRGRYGSPVLSKVLPDLLARMAAPEMEWLSLTKGQRGFFGEGRLTTIKPTMRILARMRDAGITLADLGRNDSDETIILKAPKRNRHDSGELLDYKDTAKTIKYRDQMVRINGWLAHAQIDFDDAASPDKLVDTGDRRLRRVFNNGRFDHGGRLYGGFWQDLGKLERAKGLTIGGQSVVALDYGQMAPRILYGMAGAQPPSGDMYIVPGLERHRALVKLLLNAAQFRDKRFTRYPQGAKDLSEERMGVSDVMKRIEAHHQPIAHQLFTMVGFNVQFRESEILVDVLLRLIDQKVVALPIHDALVVAESDGPAAKGIMVSAFHDHTGVEAIVKVERGA